MGHYTETIKFSVKVCEMYTDEDPIPDRYYIIKTKDSASNMCWYGCDEVGTFTSFMLLHINLKILD